MRCTYCGRDSSPSAQFCEGCGRSLTTGSGGTGPVMEPWAPAQYQQAQNQPMPDQTARDKAVSRILTANENLICRIFGFLSWIMVSIGTFMIAGGWLGIIHYTYTSGSSGPSYDMFGYAIMVYAIGAIFVSIIKFIKNP